jgi:hypothetical protein
MLDFGALGTWTRTKRHRIREKRLPSLGSGANSNQTCKYAQPPDRFLDLLERFVSSRLDFEIP